MMKHRLLSFVLLLSPLGCAQSGVSMIQDESAYPPGHYGLYERKSGTLILTRELKAGETFGFEYIGRRPTALNITQVAKPPDRGSATVWRVPLRPDEYEWRTISAATPIPPDMPPRR